MARRIITAHQQQMSVNANAPVASSPALVSREGGGNKVNANSEQSGPLVMRSGATNPSRERQMPTDSE